MISFQICIFDILKTITHFTTNLCRVLWFPFKFVSLTYWKQLLDTYMFCHMCGDFLSNLYLWHIENNRVASNKQFRLLWFPFKFVSLTYWKQFPSFCKRDSAVVISFQICIFDILKTIDYFTIGKYLVLWFPFKFVSLTYWKQFWAHLIAFCKCCDFLSNLYLWHIENNLPCFS